MRCPIARLVLCARTSLSGAAATEATPRDVAAAIYAREIADEKKGDATAFTDRDLRAAYFSQTFNGLITRDEARAARTHESGAPDVDPVISGLDGAATSPE